jgi:hypothetical protein
VLHDDADEAVKLAKHALGDYQAKFVAYYADLMREKLGFAQTFDDDQSIVTALLDLLEANNVDYTLFFRVLSQRLIDADDSRCRDLFIDRAAFDQWYALYQARLKQENMFPATRSEQMKQVNPKYILRNYMTEIAIRKAQDENDYSEIDNLMTILRNPFEEHPDFEHYAGHPPEWAQRIEVSCSS